MNKTSSLLFALCTAAIVTAQTAPPPVTAVATTVTTATTAPATNSPAVAVTPVALPVSVIPPVGAAEQPVASGETSLSLDVGNGIRYVPPSRVTVPVGETLRITGPSYGGRPVQWSKNGKDLPGATANPLVLSHVTAADAGVYAVGINDPLALAVPSQTLILGVGPTDRLVNISTRGVLAAGAGQSFTAGFVVGGSGSSLKKLILRAVGPSLASFGVTNPLRAPVLRVFDSAGKPYTNGYVYPAVVGGPTYESDLAESLAKTGAFPIPTGTLDAVVMMPFAPGAYTAQVTSGDNSAGSVLVEIYEVP